MTDFAATKLPNLGWSADEASPVAVIEASNRAYFEACPRRGNLAGRPRSNGYPPVGQRVENRRGRELSELAGDRVVTGNTGAVPVRPLAAVLVASHGFLADAVVADFPFDSY
ncbi:hypothetical protein [Nocardia sp. NPDC059691]|uniref:hypothetical protein n=1 Tax=Nocardia sp. NPDC059691 TaxID=3346908 RepID=UPI003697F8AD